MPQGTGRSLVIKASKLDDLSKKAPGHVDQGGIEHCNTDTLYTQGESALNRSSL